MPSLLPPVVYGPITPLSTSVLVSGLVPGATVTLYADGNPLTPTSVASATTTLVALGKALKAGQSITASQANPPAPPGTTPSAKSSPGVPVIPVPGVLPTPSFVSAVSTCVDSVQIDGVIPGATVTVKQGSTKWTTVPGQSPCWVNLTGSGAFAAGSTLEALQSVGSINSPTATSLPLEPAVGGATGQEGFGPPKIVQPLLACQTLLSFENMVASLDIEVVNGTTTEGATAPSQSFAAVSAPLQAGTLTAHQLSTRCSLTGKSVTYPVTSNPPPKPKLVVPVCPALNWISLTNLVPGAVLYITLVWTATDGTTETQPWGYGGISATTESFDLGTLPSTGPKGETSLSIQVEQILCPYSGSGTNHERDSGTATLPLAPGGGPFPAPNPPKNLYACAREILVTGAHPGSLLQAFSGATPLSNVVVAGSSDVTIKLWLPLVAGEPVSVKQTGCNANGTSAPPAIVNPLKSLAAPTIVTPVLAGATSVEIDGVTPGARVSLFVNGLVRSSVDSVTAKISVPAGWPALAAGDKLSAAQALCTEIATTNDTQGVTVVAPVPAPASGLGSNSNYILYNNCKVLTNVSVTIDVTQDMVCASASGPTVGFSFQLNAYSLKGKLCALQQYVVALFGSQVIGGVDNWPVSGPNIINDFFNLVSLSGAAIPAGYKLKISLENDTSGNVTGATYIVIDNTGATLATSTQTLLSLSGVTAADLAPIVAFELDIVGPINSESAVLSSGAGTISYTASAALTVLKAEPTTCTETTDITAETANTVYGLLPAGPSKTSIQTFNVTKAAIIRKPGKTHALTPRRMPS